MKRCVPLERAAEKICEENSTSPLIFQLPPEQGRAVLDTVQDTPVTMQPARIVETEADTGEWGCIRVFSILPDEYAEPADVILYIHGAGWVFGNFHTHEKLVRELAARTNSVVVFPEYSLSPEAVYPVALEQCYFVLSHLPLIGQKAGFSINPFSLTVAGDSAGGNIAASLAILCKERGGPILHKQLLYYPVTNACFDTPSYRRFACGYYLYRAGMQWFWKQYCPHERDRRRTSASPLRASLQDLEGLPDAMIVNGEADVLRDEGQAYAQRLRLAGVNVTALCCQGTIHDFVMLNALDQTAACRMAMDASVAWLLRKNNEIHKKEPQNSNRD